MLVAGALAGCGLRIPADVDGTLDRASGGELRVGASASEQLVRLTGDSVAGPLPELVEGFADSIGADIEWSLGSEEELVDALEDGSIDLAIGGMTDRTPWSDRAGVTRGYSGVSGADGKSIVVLVPMGENALLFALESYLDEELGG